MTYLVYSNIDHKVEKKIKNFRFKFNRNSINEDVLLELIKMDADYFDMKDIIKNVNNTLKAINKIKISLSHPLLLDNEIVIPINDNSKINKFKQSVISQRKSAIFSNHQPNIPIIKLLDYDSEEMIQIIKNSLNRSEFFIHEIGIKIINENVHEVIFKREI